MHWYPPKECSKDSQKEFLGANKIQLGKDEILYD